MAQTFIGRKRIRKRFGTIADAAEMPNLIEVQKQSYDQFLMVQEPVGGRPLTGLQAVFASIFPIKDFSDKAQLEFVRYDFEPPKYDVDECQQRSMTYAAPLKVKLRLITFDVNEETGSRSVRDIKEQDVYMGDIPFMTSNGTFIINGTERVIVSQMHRSPGVFFHHDGGKSHSSGKLLFAARIIPYRGSWLDFEFDAKDIVFARIDRKRKLPTTTLLYALGMNNEEILETFYKRIIYKATKQGWRTPFLAERMRGVKAVQDIYDADTGEVVIEAGKKLNARAVRQLAERVKAVAVPDDALYGRYLAEDIVNMQTGEIWAEAGDELDAKVIDKLRSHDVEELPVLDIDHVNTGSFIRNTLHADKNQNEQDALFDIYRVMRPGEPPTEDAARALFKSLFFDEERYDLSSVGRVKMNIRLEIEQSDEMRILTKEDIIAVIRTLVDLARRPRRGRRHRQSRQSPRAVGGRADGKSVSPRPAAHGARHSRAYVVRRYRHGHAAGSDQREARERGRARILRLLAAQPVHGPDEPAVGNHAQAPPLRAWAGRPDARARRLRGARRASDALRPHLPYRDAGRPEYRPYQLARDVCAREQIRLHREPLPQGRGRKGHGRGGLSLGHGGGALSHRASEREAEPRRKLRRGADYLPPSGRRVSRPAEQSGFHRRFAEAGRVGGRGAHSVP